MTNSSSPLPSRETSHTSSCGTPTAAIPIIAIVIFSYDLLFETADALGLGYEAMEELFRRMAFNVYNREMDDHTKNFSFLMCESGRWKLAPTYDLTGCHFSPADSAWGDWQNQHALSVNGKFSRITDDDLLTVGERYGIGTAPKVLTRVKEAFSG